ncbi:ferredoxin [Maridesulfovibrio sp.]|uniref:ferredoxin n=1 Tax=Maridesulfovibrio sp. TaxID=2795000 RepID=UPI0029F5AA70|nr:ferredoxin [Maridesulfovibrio sp.]
MTRTVVVDVDECVGCEACVEECPDVFSMGPGDLALVHNPEGADDECIESAMELCPVNCIHWEE